MTYPSFIKVSELRAAESRMDGMHSSFYDAVFFEYYFLFHDTANNTVDDITDAESMYFMGLEPYATSNVLDLPPKIEYVY